MLVLHSAHLSNHKSPRFVIPFLFTSDCRGLALPLSKPFFFTGFSQHPPPLLPSLLIDVTAYPQIQHRQNTKPIHPTGFLLHHTQPERVFFLLIPDDTLIQYPQFFPLLLFFSYEKTYIYTQGLLRDSSVLLSQLPFPALYSCCYTDSTHSN